MSATCDMYEECTEPITHIGAKGYVYCADHAPMRQGYERTRKMRAWERRWISEGRALPSYIPGPEPKPRHTVRGEDVDNAVRVLNSSSLSRSNGELREALKALVSFAEPVA